MTGVLAVVKQERLTAIHTAKYTVTATLAIAGIDMAKSSVSSTCRAQFGYATALRCSNPTQLPICRTDGRQWRRLADHARGLDSGPGAAVYEFRWRDG